MENKIIGDFLVRIEELRGFDYLYALVAYHIAPTIEGVKPASIITLNNDKRDLYSLWNNNKYIFYENWDIKFLELKSDSENLTILFYRENLIKNVIYKTESMSYLSKFGYEQKMKLDEIFTLLKSRFYNTFPHEIGIFLGFPLEDVRAFIDHPERKCLVYGYWKVYTNLTKAKSSFAMYDAAKKKVISDVLKDVNLH